MEQTIKNSFPKISSIPNRAKICFGIVTLIIGLSVFQDYLFSQIRDTGFYISESLLYNSIWAFLVPMAFLETKLLNHIDVKNNLKAIFYALTISGVFALVHIFIFTSFFVLVSYLVFSPTHLFLRIFNTALSNEFSVLVLFYIATPFLLKFYKKPFQHSPTSSQYPKNIKVKIGLKTVSIKVEAIEIISTEKPYTVIISDNTTYLDNRTLKDFETILNPKFFRRVHRSVIINKTLVIELKSRKNGDYDAMLRNGKTVRLSRHYRTSWIDLLQ